jgi:hypothetical protein
MLIIDGLLGAQADADTFARFALARVRTGAAPEV